MQAVILAGGPGKRLRPFTSVIPKPLMPIDQSPILEIILRQLKAGGFKKITLTLGYLGEIIRAVFGDGSKYGLEINYSQEEIPLGTAGPLTLIGNLEDNFLVMNGDILSDIDFKALWEYHLHGGSELTICSYDKEVPINLGVLKLEGETKVVDYIEKPILYYPVSMGIYVFNKSLVDIIPQNQYFDLPDLVKKLISIKANINIYKHKGLWLDIGVNDDYERANQIFMDNKSKFLP